MKPIFLIGYMGCGKSTLGRKLARRLMVPFRDTDALVEACEGATVADIFRYEGEERFRELEREAVCRAAAEDRMCVVSTGGGLPAWRDNMELLNRMGHTVYLRRTAADIARRLSPYGRRKRPRLAGLNEAELIEFMSCDMARREPFYAAAHMVIDCEGLSDEELMEVVLREVKDDK